MPAASIGNSSGKIGQKRSPVFGESIRILLLSQRMSVHLSVEHFARAPHPAESSKCEYQTPIVIGARLEHIGGDLGRYVELPLGICFVATLEPGKRALSLISRSLTAAKNIVLARLTCLLTVASACFLSVINHRRQRSASAGVMVVNGFRSLEIFDQQSAGVFEVFNRARFAILSANDVRIEIRPQQVAGIGCNDWVDGLGQSEFDELGAYPPLAIITGPSLGIGCWSATGGVSVNQFTHVPKDCIGSTLANVTEPQCSARLCWSRQRIL